MEYAVVAGLGLLVGVVVGWIIGSRKAASPSVGEAPEREPAASRPPDGLAELVEALRAGEPAALEELSSPADSAVRELREILLRDWAPRGDKEEAGGAEDEALVDKVVNRALGRLAVYLRNRIEAPLLEGLETGGVALEEGADRALGAVEDLEFFLETSDSDPDLLPLELGEVVDEVLDEFKAQSSVTIELSPSADPLPVLADAERLKDAVFLTLHNADEFGDGQAVKVTLRREGNRAVLRILDQGPGFTADALLDALNPFYSTSPEGLGLGLPHALKLVRAQGGEILLRTPEGGGGEVEIVLPLQAT